jgi:hypothetical protein
MFSSSLWRIASAALIGLTPALPVAAGGALPGLVGNYIADARVAGAGSLTWFGLSVYDARLIVPASFRAADALASPLVLEITYARALDGGKIAERSRDEIVKLGLGNDTQRAAWLEAMKRVFPDVKSGTRIAGVYLGERGARFYVDGSFAGAVEDPEFARAFFSIWLDPRTSAPRLRDALLASALR